MNINHSYSQIKQMTQMAVQFGRAQSASKQENLRHIEASTAKQEQVANKVVQQAVENRYDSADLKGRLIDTMV